MPTGGEPAAATKHELGGHEFAVVFADGAGRGLKPGIGPIGAGGPLPQLAMALEQRLSMLNPGQLPFRFVGQTCPGPAGIGIGFEPAEVTHRPVIL